MMTIRQLKEALAGSAQVIVTKVNGNDVEPEEYKYEGIAQDVHQVAKMTIASAGRVEVEIVGGTSSRKYNTQGFQRIAR